MRRRRPPAEAMAGSKMIFLALLGEPAAAAARRD